MIKNNKRLYNNLIQNISKTIKNILNEGIQNFNPMDYEDDEDDLINKQTIDNLTIVDALIDMFNGVIDKVKKFGTRKKILQALYPTICIYISIDNVYYVKIFEYELRDISYSKPDIRKLKNILNKNLYKFRISLEFFCFNDFRYDVKRRTLDNAVEIIKRYIHNPDIKNKYKAKIMGQIDEFRIIVDNKTGLNFYPAFENILVCLNDYLEYLKSQEI